VNLQSAPFSHLMHTPISSNPSGKKAPGGLGRGGELLVISRTKEHPKSAAVATALAEKCSHQHPQKKAPMDSKTTSVGEEVDVGDY